jgi:hypothetical protein
MFEYRPVMDGCSTNDTFGVPIFKRVQRGGITTCGDCYGSLSWDWEPYTHIVTVNLANRDNHNRMSRYLHLHFRLCGRADSSTNPPQYLKIDTVTAVRNGDTIPPCDINLDGRCDLFDFAILANDWLLTMQMFP